MRAARPALLSVALLLAACAPAERPLPPAPPPVGPVGWLQGTEWTLVEFRGEPAPFAAGIRFENNRLAGRAACNRYLGGITQEGDVIDIGAVAATRMACPEGEAESAYFAALTDVKAAGLGEGRLVFYDAAGLPLMAFAGG